MTSGLSDKEKLNIVTYGKIERVIDKYRNVKPFKIVETIVDPEQQLENFRNNKIQSIPPRHLYNYSSTSKPQKLVNLYRENIVSSPNDESIVTIPIINSESKNRLINEEYTLLHLGCIMIGIKGIHRKELGTKVFIGLMDTRHNDIIPSIIANMEVDMSTNSQIIYVLPDFPYPLELLDTHLKLIIKSKGYNMIDNAKNLLICQNIIGKITTGSEIGYSIKEIEIVKFLASKGIKAIPGKKIEKTELLENTWNISKSFNNKTIAPTNAQYYTDIKGNVNLRFVNYKETNQVEDEQE